MPYPKNILNALPLKRDSGEVQRVSTYNKHTYYSKQTQVYDEEADKSDKQEKSDEGDENEKYDEDNEFVMDRINTQRVNKNQKHQYANVGRYLYRVRWFGYLPSDDN